jgi:hypothetical protein
MKFKVEGRGRSTRILSGHKELDKKLKELKNTEANKIVRKATTKGVRMIVNGIKKGVPAPYKKAKKAIGSKLKVNTKGVDARIGASVGKKMDKESKERKGSVGITTGTIHWFLMGTRRRKRNKVEGFLAESATNTDTGTMPAVMEDLVKQGFRSTQAAALTRIRGEIFVGLKQFAAKNA